MASGTPTTRTIILGTHSRIIVLVVGVPLATVSAFARSFGGLLGSLSLPLSLPATLARLGEQSWQLLLVAQWIVGANVGMLAAGAGWSPLAGGLAVLGKA